MTHYIDISLPISVDLPIWPGSSGFVLQQTRSLANGDGVNESRFETNVHIGTHVDAPLHFIENGSPVDRLDLDVLIGPVVVVDLPDCPVITATVLEALNLSHETKRLLLHTDNSKLWARGEKNFNRDFVALSVDGAQWVVDHGIVLVGIDYLSIQRFSDGPAVHRVLLENGTVLLEGLNLDAVGAGYYELICLPLPLVGAEGAPARAILKRLPHQKSGDNE